ncbi:MAG: transcription termination/antitermination protein NusG [Verrucomicrobia bacterium]|nr:transcription termination/antitermination protein NusG [Verrucomicrobiota bacterium]
MHKWYVVQVLSSQEKKTKKALEENRQAHGMLECIERVVLPTENVSEVKRGQQRVVEKRLWPGYLLIKMELNELSWMYVNNTTGVVDFLGGENPNELSETEVEALLKEMEDRRTKVSQKHKFEVGDRVKITDGVFVNFVGTVVEVFQEKGRLSVLVSIFGRDTRVDDLEFWQVEEAVDETSLS